MPRQKSGIIASCCYPTIQQRFAMHKRQCPSGDKFTITKHKPDPLHMWDYRASIVYSLSNCNSYNTNNGGKCNQKLGLNLWASNHQESNFLNANENESNQVCSLGTLNLIQLTCIYLINLTTRHKTETFLIVIKNCD